MKLSLGIFFLVTSWISGINYVVAESRTNFKLQQLVIRHTDPTFKVFINFTTENNKQFLNYDVTLPVPADEHIGIVVDIQSLLIDKTIVPLFTMREKYLCKSANKFLGEFWYTILRGGQISPGVCPIQAGRYHGHHIQLDFTRITLQTFPFGKLRFIFKINDDRRPKAVLLDMLVDVENISN